MTKCVIRDINCWKRIHVFSMFIVSIGKRRNRRRVQLFNKSIVTQGTQILQNKIVKSKILAKCKDKQTYITQQLKLDGRTWVNESLIQIINSSIS